MTRIAEIEARLSAATPGPWEAYVFPIRKRSRKTGRVLAYRPEDGTAGSVSVVPSDGVYGVMDGPDAELIAHAPTDLAALIEVVKAVQAVGHADDGSGDCIECGWESGWPCPTAAALSKLEES